MAARSKVVLAAVALALVTRFGAARGEVRGLVSGPGRRAFPIAVADPLAEPGTSREVGSTFARALRRDLRLAGLFELIPRVAVEGADEEGSTADVFARWRAAGAHLLVRSRYREEAGAVTLEARLFDLDEERQVAGKRYRGAAAGARRMGHRFADEILLALTGTRGPFDARIAFVSTRGGRAKEIWVANLDGSGLRQLTRNGTINLDPRWAPDGRSLLFTSYRDGRPKVYEMELASGRLRLVAAGPGLTLGGVYSPDGARIAVAREESKGNSEVVVLDRRGALVARVTRDEAIDVSPTWAPDGRRLAYCSARAGSPQIYVADLGSGLRRRVTFEGSYNTQPAWSPVGERIAYTARVGGRFQIRVLDLATGSTHRVTASAGDNVDPAWSPDGRYLVFSSTRDGAPRLWISDWRGRAQSALIGGPGGDTSPAWSPRLGRAAPAGEERRS